MTGNWMRAGRTLKLDAGLRRITRRGATVLLPVAVLAMSGFEKALAIDPWPLPTWSAYGGGESSRFGIALSTAGDVNGDGYSDIITGAPGFRFGTSLIGQVRVYHGSANGLGTTPAWSRAGSSSDERFGWCVATAGDINGDGYGDVVAGAPYHSWMNTEDGRIRVFLGSATGLGPVPSMEYSHGQHHSYLGWSVAGGGDFNADGYDDFVTGSPFMENGEMDEGIVHVFHGRATGVPSVPSQALDIDIAGARFGSSCAVAGDVNGDGFDDLAVGAPGNGSILGRAYVFLGGPSGLSGSPAWTMSGGSTTDFGSAVAGAGDVNGDGYADILVGARLHDQPSPDCGQVWLYLGSSSGPGVVHAWTTTLGQSGAQFGASLATAGDIDGDGYADVVVGAPYFDAWSTNEGTARLYRGSASGLSATPGYYYGNQGGAVFGACVGTAGDVNSDGFSDLLIGASFWSENIASEGRVFLYHGAAGLPASTPNWSWDGPDPGGASYSGEKSICHGDFNSDGESDVAIGDPAAEGGTGQVNVFYGSPDGFSHLPSRTYHGTQEAGLLGYQVTAGDIDGDRFDDLIVSAPGINYSASTYPGRIFIYRGGIGLPLSADHQISGDENSSRFGQVLQWVGDLNRDGCGEFVVCAPQENRSEERGRAFLYFGNRTNIVAPGPLIRDGALMEQLGSDVAGPCDLNGDGYGDWVISSASASSPDGYVGVVRGFLGGPTLDFEPDWEAWGMTYGTGFGATVATGDLNGDAKSDVLVGEPNYYIQGSWGSSLGRVWAYAGNAAGAASSPFWGFSGNQDFGQFGASVDCVGDLDGDGLGEVLIGHPGYASSTDPSELAEGRICLFEPASEEFVWSMESNQALHYLGLLVSAAGDVTSDGIPDFMSVERNGEFASAATFNLHYGTGAPGVIRAVSQAHPDNGYNIPLLGRTEEPSFRIRLRGRSAGGRERVRLQYQVKEAGLVFGAGDMAESGWVDTNPPVPGEGSRVWIDQTVDGLNPGFHHWRARVRSASPFFPTSRWVTLVGNGLQDDLLVGAPIISGADDAAPDAAAGGIRIRLHGANPFRNSAQIEYAIPQTTHVRLTVHDVLGREVARLVDEVRPSGPHAIAWSPSAASGGSGSGVYFVRLSTPDGVDATRITRLN